MHVVTVSKSTISCNVFGQFCFHFSRDTFVVRILDVILSFRILLLYRSSQKNFAGGVVQYHIIMVQLFSEPVCLGHGFHNHKCFSAPGSPFYRGDRMFILSWSGYSPSPMWL